MLLNENTASTVNIRKIEKDPILGLGLSQKDVKKYEKALSEYGNVIPAIVGEADGVYKILAGTAGLEACARLGIEKINVIVSMANGETEQMKLALLLSTIREEGGAISEGEFINRLITSHGVTRRELSKLLGKSKSWISKRQALAVNLSDAVKGMVTDGSICARTAEEIAKLPTESQAEFAANTVRDCLNKTDVSQLVKLYRMPQTSAECRKAIIEAPLTVLPALPETVKRKKPQKDTRGLSERLSCAARHAVRVLYEVRQLIAAANKADLTYAGYYLRDLREAIFTTDIDLKDAAGFVSPGKQGGGQAL